MVLAEEKRKKYMELFGIRISKPMLEVSIGSEDISNQCRENGLYKMVLGHLANHLERNWMVTLYFILKNIPNLLNTEI